MKATRPRSPRLLTPSANPEAPRAYSMTGTLHHRHARGYGFLFTGKGEPDYFLMRSQVPPEAWVKDARFGFNPLPPKDGTTSPRCADVVVLSIPSDSSNGNGNHATTF